MTTVFTERRAPVDRALLSANTTLGALVLGVLALAVLGVRADGWLDVPVAAALFAWLFATPILAGAGAFRAHAAGWRRALATHSLLAGVWALGMAAALVVPLLRATA